jgi:hypothetical protein
MKILTTALARTAVAIGLAVCTAGIAGTALASAGTPEDVIAYRVQALYQDTKNPSFYTPACWAHAKPTQQSFGIGVPASVDGLDIYVDGNDATVSFIQGVIPVHQHWVLRGGQWLLDC